jgi:hypothetical protein
MSKYTSLPSTFKDILVSLERKQCMLSLIRSGEFRAVTSFPKPIYALAI